MRQEIIDKIKAGYPCLYLVTSEEQRAEAEIQAVGEELKHTVFIWDAVRGLVDIGSGEILGKEDAFDVIKHIALQDSSDKKQIYLLKDYHMFIGNPDAGIVAAFKLAVRECETSTKKIILVGCKQQLPPELEKEISLVELDLPNKEDRLKILTTLAKENKIEINGNTDSIIRASAGLTSTEVTNAFSLSLAKKKEFDVEIIHKEKANALKKNDILEVIETCLTVDNVGGLQVIKEWIQKRIRAFTDAAKEFGLPEPKGMLLVGCPGTGKSLVSKVVAKIFGIPLLRLDAGKLFGSLVGQSEERVRTAIKTAEAIAPCVLWIDEIEKGFSGSQSSSSTDGGTSSRVFGSFITWMQEKSSPVFVMATANDVTQLPPEMLRKGRFDEMFFVDLPTTEERQQIWRVLLNKYDRKTFTSVDIGKLANRSNKYTGAEIEQAIVNALYQSFDVNEPINMQMLYDSIEEIVPLSKTAGASIDKLRDWAKGKTRNASIPEKTESRARKVLNN